ncbi:hypothetical protein I4U23_017961 [Adineta vaga]|nr:hypothetical protein I4U23_017961 [Adineta vaga]
MKSNGYDNDYHRRTPPQIDDHVDDDRDEERMTRSHHQQQYAPSNKKVNQEDKDHAATVIQSHVRGYLTRKQPHHEREQHTDQLTNNHDNEEESTKQLTDDHDGKRNTNPLIDKQAEQKAHQEVHKNENENEKVHQDHLSSQANESQDSMLKSLANLTVQQAVKEALVINNKQTKDNEIRVSVLQYSSN